MSKMKNHVQPSTRELRQGGCYEFKASLGCREGLLPPIPPKENQNKDEEWLETQREGTACPVSHSQPVGELSFEPKSI